MFRHCLTLLIALFLVTLVSAQSSTDHLIVDKISSIPETKKIISTNKYPTENTDNFKDIKVTGVVFRKDKTTKFLAAVAILYGHRISTNAQVRNGENARGISRGHADYRTIPTDGVGSIAPRKYDIHSAIRTGGSRWLIHLRTIQEDGRRINQRKAGGFHTTRRIGNGHFVQPRRNVDVVFRPIKGIHIPIDAYDGRTTVDE